MDPELGTLERLAALLGPAGAVLLLVVVGLFTLAKMGYLHVGRSGSTEPDRPEKQDPPCASACPFRPEYVQRLESACAAIQRLESDVATHHRILVTPDAGSRSVIGRLEQVEQALTRIETLLREAIRVSRGGNSGDQPA